MEFVFVLVAKAILICSFCLAVQRNGSESLDCSQAVCYFYFFVHTPNVHQSQHRFTCMLPNETDSIWLNWLEFDVVISRFVFANVCSFFLLIRLLRFEPKKEEEDCLFSSKRKFGRTSLCSSFVGPKKLSRSNWDFVVSDFHTVRYTVSSFPMIFFIWEQFVCHFEWQAARQFGLVDIHRWWCINVVRLCYFRMSIFVCGRKNEQGNLEQIAWLRKIASFSHGNIWQGIRRDNVRFHSVFI